MAQNTSLLQIAGVLESVRTAIVTGQGTAYDRDEVLVLCLQATIQIICGGAPSQIILPETGSAITGLDDAAIARFCRGQINATPFIPVTHNAATVTGVPADGSAAQAITFTFEFPTAASQVLYGLRDYTGADPNAFLGAKIVYGSLTKTGCSILVGGGELGSTVSVDYVPFGS